MRILVITDSYPPEVRSASHLMAELAENLKKLGHEITVLTSYPAYNLANGNITFSEVENEAGIRVIRIKTLPHHKVNFIFRGFSQLFMPITFFRAAKRLAGPTDAIFIHTPPLPLALAAVALKRRFKARFVLNVHDIFPQNAVDLGILKVSFLPFSTAVLKWFFEKMESYIYREADAIVVPSAGHKEFLERMRGVPPEKVSSVPHWVDMRQFEEAKRTNRFREKFGIGRDKFIFFFGGILGPSQSLEFMLQIAERMKNLPEAVFLFVGDGTEKEKLMEIAKEKNLENVIFKPLVLKEKFPFLLKDADVGLVSLTSRNTTPIFPAKIPAYMAAGVPVLAFVNKESLRSTLIEEAKCGFVAESTDIGKAEELVRKMYRDRKTVAKLGENGRLFAEKNLNAALAAREIEKILKSVI